MYIYIFRFYFFFWRGGVKENFKENIDKKELFKKGEAFANL